jgi:hypothetical protein
VVAEAIRKRDLVTKWIGHAGSVEAAVGELCGILGVDAGDGRAGRRRDGERPDPRRRNGWRWRPARWRIEDRSRCRGWSVAGAAAVDGEERAKLYRRVFITETTLTPRKQVDRQDGSRAVRPVARRA